MWFLRDFGGGWAWRDARGATPPAQRSRPPPPPSSLRALHRALFFFVTYFSNTQLTGTSTCPGRSSPPPPASIGRRPRPPLSAPLARDGVIGGNRSFLIPARAKLHPALCWTAAAAAHPRRIPPGKLQDQERAGKTSGSRRREALGPHPPFPGRPHPSSLGAASPLPGLSASLLLGGRTPSSRLPRGYSRFSRPGAAGGGGSAHPASQGLGVCKEKDNNHGFLQTLAQPLRSSASTPV